MILELLITSIVKNILKSHDDVLFILYFRYYNVCTNFEYNIHIYTDITCQIYKNTHFYTDMSIIHFCNVVDG